MKTIFHFSEFYREYKSILLRFILLVMGLLLINFTQAQSGNVCSTPIVVTGVPFTHSGNVAAYGNDYDDQDIPYVVNNPYSDTEFNPSYLNGSDVVYHFTPTVEGYVNINFSSNQLNSSVWVLVDCPFGAAVGWDYSSTEYEGEIVNLPINPGETLYFVLSSSNPSANYDFDFELSFVFPGTICEVPKVINSLPYTNTNTLGYFGNDYNYTDMPPASPDAIHDKPYDSSYLNGYDFVYSYTPTANGYIDASIYASANNVNISVLTGCPFQSAIGWDHVSGGGYAYVTNIPVVLGQTYYFVISTSIPLANHIFAFFLEESEGLICEAPFQVSSFPYSASGEVPDRTDYDENDAPPASPSAINNVPYNNLYLRGPEVVFAYTPSATEYIDASATASEFYASLWVFTGCPFQSTMGWDYSSNQGYIEINEIKVLAGVTYYFVLSGFYPNQTYSYTFNLSKSHGAVCETPLKIVDLPFVHEDVLSAYGNDYSSDDIPPAISNPIAASPLDISKMSGNEVVYIYVPGSDQYVTAKAQGGGFYKGLWVFTGCPFDEMHAWNTYTTQDLLQINDIPLQAGVVYYFVVSYTYLSSIEFTFELEESFPYDCPVLEKNMGDVCSDGNPATTGDHVNQNCECLGYENNGSAIFTVPQAVTCGDRNLVVRSYVPSSDILISTATQEIFNYNTFVVNNLPVGNVDMYIEIDGALRILLAGQTITDAANLIEINDLVLGDLTDDNGINISDISAFAASFGSAPNDSNYNHLANINCDSSINIVDLSMLGASFGLQGVSIP